MQLNAELMAYAILGVGTTIAYLTAPLYWMKSCRSEQSSRLQILLFEGKIRRVCTTLLIILGSAVAAILVVPSMTLDVITTGAFLVVFILAFQLSIYMTFKIGPLSFATRDRIVAEEIVRSHNDGLLTDEYLRAGVGCIVAEARKNNTTSIAVLRELAERSDELGQRVQHLLNVLGNPLEHGEAH